jgi:hypothetical protein
MLDVVQMQSIGEVQVNDVTIGRERTNSFLIRTYLERDQFHQPGFLLRLSRSLLTLIYPIHTRGQRRNSTESAHSTVSLTARNALSDSAFDGSVLTPATLRS